MSERIDNSPTGGAHCNFCCDDGVVVVGGESREFNRVRASHEVIGPCPACARGNALEFPPSGRTSPWGRDGFWRGRPWQGLKPRCQCNSTPLRREEGIQLAGLEARRDRRPPEPPVADPERSVLRGLMSDVSDRPSGPEPGTQPQVEIPTL